MLAEVPHPHEACHAPLVRHHLGWVSLRMSSARETALRALWGTDEFLDTTGRRINVNFIEHEAECGKTKHVIFRRNVDPVLACEQISGARPPELPKVAVGDRRAGGGVSPARGPRYLIRAAAKSRRGPPPRISASTMT